MKILIVGSRDRYERFLPEKIRTGDFELISPVAISVRKGEVYEPYDFRVKYQAIRDYGWSVTLAFDLMNEQ